MSLYKRLICTAAALAMLSGCSSEPAVIDAPPSESRTDASGDFHISDITPGSDYFGYINADSLMDMELPYDKSSVGTFDTVQDAVNDQLEEIIKDISAGSGYAPGSNEQLIHDVYDIAYSTNSGALDTEESDEALVSDFIARVYSTDSISALCDVWGDIIADYGTPVVFPPTYERDLYGSGEYVLYVNFFPYSDIDKLLEDNFAAGSDCDHYTDLLTSTGISREDAKLRARDIVYMALDIASVTDMSALENMEFEKMFYGLTISEADSMFTNIGSSGLLRAMGVDEPQNGIIYFSQPEQVQMIDSLLTEDNLQAWQDFTVCAFLERFADALPKKYRTGEAAQMMTDEDFAVSAVNMILSEQIGEEYAELYFNEEMLGDIMQMCEDIREEYRVLIADCEWLSDEGKAALTEKLDMMQFFIGADEPHETDPHDAELIGSSLLDTYIRMRADDMKRELGKAGQPCEINGFGSMAPQEVNACYDPQQNCFYISVAVLNSPFYDADADYYTNLGGIGATIGHELSHGFDSMGVKYDGTGAFNDTWLPQEDIDAFEALQDRAVKYFDTFTVLDTYHVNGRKTLGENLADISGLQCMLAIAGTPDAQKKVLENYARIWAELTEDSYAKMLIKDDVHSPCIVRVNAVVACFDEFYDIYGVTEDDAMYVAPEDRIRRW